MLSLQQLSYHPASTPTPILTGVSLTLAPNQVGVVIGNSGAGKSTLLELVAGLTRPTSGSIQWQNQALTPSQLRRLAGLVFQFPERHFCGSSLREELAFGHPEVRLADMEHVLTQVGLAGIPLTYPPHRLSGGQQRRLALAVQLIRSPFLLLLDEPTAGLDWSVRHQILQLLGQLKSTWTLLIVSHDPEELESIADYQWQMQQGQLLVTVRPDRGLTNEENRLT